MTSLILPLIALVIALLIIAALWLWWSGERSDELPLPGQSTDLMEAAHTLAPAPAAPLTTTFSDQPTPTRSEAPAHTPFLSSVPPAPAGNELLRAISAADGRMSVLFGGVTYRTMNEMTDPEIRKQFMGILRALAQFAQDVDNGVAAPEAPAQTFVSPVSQAPASVPEAELGEPEPESMAGQIESLLQTRLIRTPGMQHRSIHIYGAPGGGVQISVDGACFDSVGDVVDAEARSVIEAAIRDWEAANPL